VPIGNGQELQQLAITEKELPQYIRSLKKARGNWLIRKLYPKTQVTMNRALQFQNSDGEHYRCSAGDSLITVDEFGNIMPCRRMPIICGNIKESTLRDVFFDHEVFMDLRDLDSPDECNGCIYSHLCRGGAKCQSYATYNSYEKADPGCWICR
jgi:radical SAM protein with 4Fe4S-binding SPASM domain